MGKYENPRHARKCSKMLFEKDALSMPNYEGTLRKLTFYNSILILP
jgi:hypothetical protein